MEIQLLCILLNMELYHQKNGKIDYNNIFFYNYNVIKNNNNHNNNHNNNYNNNKKE